jgi:hypothetical protein
MGVLGDTSCDEEDVLELLKEAMFYGISTLEERLRSLLLVPSPRYSTNSPLYSIILHPSPSPSPLASPSVPLPKPLGLTDG